MDKATAAFVLPQFEALLATVQNRADIPARVKTAAAEFVAAIKEWIGAPNA